MWRFFSLLFIFCLLVGLAFFVFFESQEQVSIFPTIKKDYLTFKNVIVSELAENKKVWELEVEKVSLSNKKDLIFLENCKGFIFNRNKEKSLKIEAFQVLIFPDENKLVFKNPELVALNEKKSLFKNLLLDTLIVFPSLKKAEGSNDIKIFGQGLKIFAQKLFADLQFERVILKNDVILNYFTPELKKELIFKTPEVEILKNEKLVIAKKPVELEWSQIKVTAKEGEYNVLNNIFMLLNDVKINYNKLLIEGEKLTFKPDDREFVITGNPVIAQRDKDVLKGEEIIFNLKNNQLKINKIGELTFNLGGF